MELITPALQTYPWGSKTLLAGLRGEEASIRPEAELWFGAHRAAPSHVGGRGLDELIASTPGETLGPRVREEYGDSLPFLLKILAADAPLSVQAHPNLQQARAGFEHENQQGIALDSPKRNYKDPNHKPELLVALTHFRALAGLRPAADTIALFEQLDCPPLSRYASMLHSDNDEEGLRALFTTWISLPRAKRLELIDAIAPLPTPSTPWMADTVQCFKELNDRYPGDVGALASLLLNYIELEPGEALFLGAGRLHAYVSGMAVEIMASSDNVLRGGLTSKHVDVPELVRICDFTTLADPRVGASTETTSYGAATEYPVPIGDFVLTRHSFGGSGGSAGGVVASSDGPAIVLATSGEVTCVGPDGAALTLTPGTAAWIPAADGQVTVQPNGPAEVFYARV